MRSPVQWWKQAVSFLTEVRAEIQKCSFPSRDEVVGTTVVVEVETCVSDALIYTISTAELVSPDGNSGLLKKLAQRSGGVTYTPKSERAVVEAFREIAGNIRRGYSIGYVPTNTIHDGRYRRVKVTVRAPGYKNLSVITRDGYLAAHHTGAN